MRRRTVLVVGAAAAAAIGSTVGLWSGSATATQTHANGAQTTSSPVVQNCATARPGYASCFSVHRAGVAPHAADATPSGFGPADIQSAYNLAGASGTDTVAIVDAYDDPNAESDLATYRSQYGLPECSTANGCFSKIDQNGGSSYPTADAGWAGEISLDVDMVSATCPGCKILLVEADSNSFADLGAAVNTAASKADIVSNSYGGGDVADSDAPYYNHPGVAITASAGDNGYQGASFPASSSTVIAVGGTSLTRDSSARGWSESVWDGTGSGCSTMNTAIAGAANSDTGCDGRAINDVSAVADPNTGVAVYDTYQASGWQVYGGTSASAPIIAATIGLAGNAASVTPDTPYGHTDALNDVTEGNNGSCSPSQLCTARAGWDGPTGNGTPNGTGAF